MCVAAQPVAEGIPAPGLDTSVTAAATYAMLPSRGPGGTPSPEFRNLPTSFHQLGVLGWTA